MLKEAPTSAGVSIVKVEIGTNKNEASYHIPSILPQNRKPDTGQISLRWLPTERLIKDKAKADEFSELLQTSNYKATGEKDKVMI